MMPCIEGAGWDEEWASLPVAVWIHGGAYEAGSAIDYNPVVLMATNKGSFITVTVNYRLSVFGFLGSKQLQSRDTAKGSTGNYGIQDQRAALLWVQRNIEAFGGDPASVTIFGESAGGGSVTNHLVQPASFPLYKNALMESGSFTPWSSHPMWHAEMVFAKTMQLSKCDSVDCLVTKDALTLVKDLAQISFVDGVTPIGEKSPTSLSLGPFSCPWSPLIDGVELEAHPIILAKQRKTNPATMAVMHGINRDEGEGFTYSLAKSLNESALNSYLRNVYGSEGAATVAALYAAQAYPTDVAGFTKYYWQALRTASDYMFGCTARMFSNAAASGKTTTVYNYIFNYHSTTGEDVIAHAAEIKYIWGDAEGQPAWNAEDYAIATEMQLAWGTFFTTGTPGGRWKAFNSVPTGSTFSISSPSDAVNPPGMGAGLKAKVCDTFYASFIESVVTAGPP
eukprot:gene8373-17515_t